MKEFCHINWENMKFYRKTEPLEEFLVKFQTLLMEIYPSLICQPVAADDGFVVDDLDKFDWETRQIENRRKIA